MSYPEIRQHDQRPGSEEVTGVVERGRAFTATRGRRRFVPRDEFTAVPRDAPGAGLDAFRADQEAALDQEPVSPYDR